MKSKTTNKAMLLLALLSCSAVVVGVSSWKTAAADTANVDGFTLVDGASVRIKEGDSGIRFQLQMDAKTYDSVTRVEDDVVASKAGMFVVPYAFVDNANAYDGEVGAYETFKQKIDIVFYDSQAQVNRIYQDGDYYYANGAVVDMKFANLNMEYVGIGYIATTTAEGTSYRFTAFTEANNARSIAYVAGGVYADYEEGTTESEILENYVLGALLGQLDTVTVGYDETTEEYTYNSATYETAAEVIAMAQGTVELSLNATEKTMLPSTSDQLSANISLTIAGESKAIETGVQFTSSDSEIVSVGKTGEVQALKVGTATITATTLGKTATCVITVGDNREEKAMAADYDLSKNGAFEMTIDDDQELISVSVGDVDVSAYATLEGTKVSIPASVMSQCPTGEVTVKVGTNGYVYTNTVTVATYVIENKTDFDTFFAAMKANGAGTKDYYVVAAKNAVINLSGASYSTATSNYFLGVFDGRGAIIKNFTLNGNGGLFGQLRLNNADTDWKDCGATLKNFALVDVAAISGNSGVLAYSTNSSVVSISNIYVSGEITKSGTSVVRAMWGSSTMNNVIINMNNTNNTTTALLGSSGTGVTLNQVYAISNVETLYSAASKMTDCALYSTNVEFFKNITSLNAENGWSDVWSFDGKGNLCFGGNIIMTKPDMRTAKELGEVYYQKGATEGLTVELDAGEIAESITVGGNNVTAVADTSVAGKVTVPAVAIETLTTGEYEVAISTANYKYETTFVYADVVISTPAEWCSFLTKNLSSSSYYTYEGEYIVLKNDIDFANYDYGSGVAWVSGAKVKALNVTGNTRGRVAFSGTLDGRGHAVKGFGAVTSVFDKLAGATIKDIAFIELNNSFGANALGLAYIPQTSASTIENVFVSIKQNGGNYQTGLFRESWTTVNVNNVIVVKLEATGTATNFGMCSSGGTISNSYAIGADYMKGTVTDGITTAATLLGDTAWLKAENGWNTDVWTINTDGNLCFGENTVVEK